MKHFLLALFACVAVGVNAQNLQLHYDFGHLNDELKTRPKLTSTVEMFRPDRWGNTFFFVDMNYQDRGVESAYWEIARELKFWKAPVAAHVEYNGGVSKTGSYADAWLVGPSYSYNNADFSKGFTVMALYKHLAKKEKSASWQVTATWYANFWKNRLSFTGFIDLWGERGPNSVGKEHSYFVMMTEPQLWLNLNQFPKVPKDFNLSVGTEWELSYNFPYENKTFYFLPTLALKWTF